MITAEIKELIEQRIIRATKEQIHLKAATIARDLGKPIIAHTIFRNNLPDVWALPQDDLVYDGIQVADYDDDWTETDRGWAFDGLKYGINLCIHALTADDRIEDMKITYNGYMVYAEINNRIKAYAPFPVWENALNMFYEGAIVKEKQRKEKEKEEKKKNRKNKLEKLWSNLKFLWGY